MIQTLDPDLDYRSKSEKCLALIGWIIIVASFFVISISLDRITHHNSNFAYFEQFGLEILCFAILFCIIGFFMIWGPVIIRKLKKSDKKVEN